jgi:Arc/MetJ-type ribon-helix-helix transcriptional regulator
MTLDVPREYEDILRDAVTSGGFASEQAALCYALKLLAAAQRQAAPSGEPQDTPFARAQRLGLIGAAAGLPRDLSSNEEHMEGFGRS